MLDVAIVEHVRAGATTTTSPALGRGSSFRAAIQRRRRLLIALCGALVVIVAVRAISSGASGASLEDAVALALGRDGLRVDPATITWLEEDDGPLRMRAALLVGRRAGELDDLYYLEVRPGGERTALDVAWLTNLSRTTSAQETGLVRRGNHAAYATRVGDRFDAVVVMDLRGEPASLTQAWPARARAQAAVTNVQETGRREGFGVRRYQIVERAPSLRLSVREGRFVATTSAGEIVLDPEREEPVAGAELVELSPQTKGMPGTIAWIVDTVRNVSWIGPEPIEWLEHRVFGAQDSLNRAYHGVVGSGDVAAEAAADLAAPTASAERIAMLTVTDPELGWPPPPLEPIIHDGAVEGEGTWIPIVEDPYVNSYPGAPPAFYQTFVRADPERNFTRVYVTLWDPRQVQLRVQAGTREPESSTGQNGTGTIPRDPTTLRRLVGAFNGGFQALHGEFGMMADGRVYLPPKPWAATVAVFDDGRVGMGSWPAPDWRGRYYDERLANQQIPEDMIDMRQNLTSVVEDGEWNPWRRWWWGAAPREADEQTFTTRSGLCLTREGFFAYFWGGGMGPEALGAAMSAARCARGIHLDMNSAHCGFELFRPIPPGETVPALSQRPRADSEHEGPMPDAGGWRLRARRAVRSMGMPFPRYSGHDGRDFFYLTLRPVLPGPPLTVPEGAEGEGVFSTRGLPHSGWPHAFARTFMGPEAERTWIVRIDPRRVVPAPLRRDEARPLAFLSAPGATGSLALLARRESSVGWTFLLDAPREGDVVILRGEPLAADADAALGVDRDGFVVYAERTSDPAPLAARLALAGVERAIGLGADSRLAFAVGGEHVGPDGFARPQVRPEASLAWLANERPASQVLWPDNAPTPYSEWGYLQGQRVRYFPEGPPRFARPPGAGE